MKWISMRMIFKERTIPRSVNLTWSRRFIAWGCLMATLGFSVSSSHAEESLIENPPFKTVKRNETKAVESIATQGSLNQRFQLNGFFDAGSGLKFSIQDQKSAKPYWVGVGESFEGIKVESWDSSKMGVVLSQNGMKEMLVIKEVKNTSASRAIAPMFNPISPKVPTTYPSPPPSLPKPTQLMEKLRREQARKNKEKPKF